MEQGAGVRRLSGDRLHTSNHAQKTFSAMKRLQLQFFLKTTCMVAL